MYKRQGVLLRGLHRRDLHRPGAHRRLAHAVRANFGVVLVRIDGDRPREEFESLRERLLGMQVDRELINLDRFLDRYHHPKENNFLFPAILRRVPESKPVLQEIGQQHKEGEDLFVDMLKALSAYEFAGDSEYPAFRDAVHRYTRFEREHAQREERDVLPLAEAHLQADDWKAIDAAFNDNRDPMFGRERSELFEKLHRDVVALVPAPVGLGAPWKSD